MLLASCAAGGEEFEELEKTGFEAASEWARFAHGFPEEDLVLDDMDVEADGLREGGGQAHQTVVEVQAGNGEGLLQVAWKLVEGFFGAADSSIGRVGGAGAPYARIVTGSQKDDSTEASPSDDSGGPLGMEILDDDDEPPRAAGTSSDAGPSDEFHQVDAAA